ncbi:MAG: nucleotidyltransferase domain-containing protein [Thermodesulfovibrionales bacterium]
MKRSLKHTIDKLKNRIIAYYGERLISLVLYGSCARGRATAESDIDLLIIADRLSMRKMKRIEEFIDNIEKGFETSSHYISPVIKTPEEASSGSLLFLDMIYDANILYDKDDFFKMVIERLRKKTEELGSKRVFKGNRWYWILKPDYKSGDVIEL